MSYIKELPQSEIDAMSRKDMDEYYNKRELNHIRDKFAMAALSGLVVKVESDGAVEGAIKLSYTIADKMMLERVK